MEKCWRHRYTIFRLAELWSWKLPEKYDWPQFESQWCAINTIHIRLEYALCCCRDSFAIYVFSFYCLCHSQLLLLLFTSILLGQSKGTQSKAISCKLCWFVFISPWPMPSIDVRNICCTSIQCKNIYIHDSTWHRHSHVTNKKRFRWLFWHPSCSLSQYKMQIQQNDTQEFFYKEKGQQLVCNANSNCDSLLLLCFSYFHQKLIAICQTKIWNKSFRMAFILSIEENKKGLLHWKWWHKTMRKKRNGWRWKKTWTNLLCYIAIFLFHIVARHSSSRQAFEGFIVVS